jgi:2-polyprenyl-3-methyl-5-hydroxy-6-metoxy-1,4-benzoquinol methylase
VADPEAERAAPGFEAVSELRENYFPFEWYRLIDASHFWFRWRLQAALLEARARGIPLDRPLRGLEIGGGTGVLRSQLERVTPWVVDMTDLQAEALRLASPGRGRTLYYDVTERRDEFVSRYDVVILFDVLEHIPEPREFLEAALAHVRPGGYFLVNVPALSFLFSGYDVAAGHVRRYDRPALVREFEGLPMRVLGMRYWGATLVPVLALRKVVLALRSRSHEETIRIGFAPPSRLVHAAFKALMHVELAVPFAPPAGASLVLAGCRTEA